MTKRQGTQRGWRLPAGWLHRLVLFLVLLLLLLYLGALLAHVLGEARFYVMPEADLWRTATSILGLVVWVTAIVAAGVAVQRGHALAVEPWRRWPWISRGVAVLAAAAALKYVSILVSRGSLPAGMRLETVTLPLRVAGWGLMAVGLLKGEEPLADVMRRERG